MQPHAGPAVLGQGVGHELGAQIRTTDPHHHDVGKWPPGTAGKAPGVHVAGKAAYLLAHGTDFGHDVGALQVDRPVFQAAGRGMQRRPLFGDIDDLAPAHGLEMFQQTAFGRQGQQGFDHGRGDTLPGIVEKKPASADAEVFQTSGRGDQMTQVLFGMLHLDRQGFQMRPGTKAVQRKDRHGVPPR